MSAATSEGTQSAVRVLAATNAERIAQFRPNQPNPKSVT